MRDKNNSDKRQIVQTRSMELSGYKCVMTIINDPDKNWSMPKKKRIKHNTTSKIKIWIRCKEIV